MELLPRFGAAMGSAGPLSAVRATCWTAYAFVSARAAELWRIRLHDEYSTRALPVPELDPDQSRLLQDCLPNSGKLDVLRLNFLGTSGLMRRVAKWGLLGPFARSRLGDSILIPVSNKAVTLTQGVALLIPTPASSPASDPFS